MHLSWFLSNLPFAYAAAVAWGLIAFSLSFVVHRHAIIDVFWGAGFLVVAVESILLSLTHHGPALSAIHYVLVIAVALWSLRLSIFLAFRQRGAGEDPRYVAILRNAKGSNESLKALKIIYLLQATLLWLVSLPLQWVASSRVTLNATPVVLGAILVGIGTFFEAVGDDQLRRFIKNPANKGITMNKGLWKYTRHPNYFGEAVLWTGFYLIACATPWGWLTLGSPILMIWLVTSLSGKPMLERKLTKTREGYAEYVATTSGFFPLPPKKR